MSETMEITISVVEISGIVIKVRANFQEAKFSLNYVLIKTKMVMENFTNNLVTTEFLSYPLNEYSNNILIIFPCF